MQQMLIMKKNNKLKFQLARTFCFNNKENKMEKYKSRSEVPEKYKWDLTDIFKGDVSLQYFNEKITHIITG